MEEGLRQLIECSRRYGSDPKYVIAGGGNTSYKTDRVLYVKASGFSLATIDEAGFVALDRSMLAGMSEKEYGDVPEDREAQVKSDLLKSRLQPEKNQRPSVEASVHNAIPHTFVVHLHPTIVNAVLCSNNASAVIGELFGTQAVFLPYITPGYILFKTIEERTAAHFQDHGVYPGIYFLQNHGIFVGADSIASVEALYEEVFDKIGKGIVQQLPVGDVEVPETVTQVLPAIRAACSAEGLRAVHIRNNALIQHFADRNRVQDIVQPFTPDGIVYCNKAPLYIDSEEDPQAILEAFSAALQRYRQENGYDPKVVLIPGMGCVSVAENNRSADVVLDVFEDVMKIAFLAGNFGGPHHMAEEDVQFIETWEVEAYRKSLLKSAGAKRAFNKVAVVTGGAQGFGRGIVEGLLREGAMVVIADINEKAGAALEQDLLRSFPAAGIRFVAADITKQQDIAALVYHTVCSFGGVDLLISNAGVLRAGALTELAEEDFDMVTSVNYKAFFLCTREISIPMRLQHAYNPQLFSDIVQINSKSGLQGSNKNFAYAGSKFGGIGLTQSFAMELISSNIKVNAICPGNFFEGPLWSDPERGLFVQYLHAGKVPGAKTIEDVKRFYESKVPVGRGCSPEDVLKTIFYVLEQNYETGQAIPVTGGQVMLN
jgi:rhamnose utilization protein RhaD (predicted bifunctional aldolase and dehydrogenase)/NAD(P)-dependent dehydrogenase (short-subunit alcohol dehydrogenase family)